MTDLDSKIKAALKERRRELMYQINDINDLLDGVYDPPKPLHRRSAAEMNEAKIMEHASSKWNTSLEFHQRTGISKIGTTRTLNRLVEDKKLVKVDINNITHYRLLPQEVRIKAGEGVVK